ncbi:cation transporting ATPase C-terminal domain-containing protein, partial [Patescibacteria group bacterium]
MTISLTQIGYFIFSITPLSYLLIKTGANLFSNKKIPAQTKAICTNITGIITKNYLEPSTLLFEKHQTKVKKDGNIKIKNLVTKENKAYPKNRLKKYESIKLMASIISLCHFPGANRIETAILKFFKECKLHKEIIQKKYEIIDEIESDSLKKFSTVVARNKETKEISAFSKGHAEKILNKCSRILIDGKKEELDNRTRRKIKKNIQRLYKKGEKSIAFAYRPLPQKKLSKYTAEFTEKDMVLLGVVGLTNPINENVIESIRIAKKANIKIFTITAIKEKKAEAIIKSVKLIKNHQFKNITGKNLKNMNPKKIKNLLKKKNLNLLFSEISSQQKEALIKRIKTTYKKVVIATPRINLKYIMKEITKARMLKQNMQKIMVHSIPCKIAQLFLLVMSIILQIPFPFTIGLLIIMDILINTPLEIGLKLEKPDFELMDRNYEHPKSIFKNKKKALHILFNGFLISIILSTVYLWNLMRHGWTY